MSPSIRRARQLAVCAGVVLGCGLPSSVQAAPGASLHVFKIAGPTSEATNPWNLFGLDATTLFSELVTTIDASAKNPKTRTLLLELRSPGLGLAQAAELAEALRGARKRGKKVVVHANDLRGWEALAAFSATRLNVAPEGSVVIAGIRAEALYYADLLSRLGLAADIEAVGAYKSAAEPMTRNTMSEPAREALQTLVDDIYADILRHVSKRRGVSQKQAQTLIDTGFFHARDAKRVGLVDTLVSWESLVEELSKGPAGDKDRAVVFPKPIDMPDVSSIFGLLKLLTQKATEDAGGKHTLALLALEGPIVMGRSSPDPFQSESRIASKDVLAALREIREDPTVKGLVVRINSPGGSALASDVIWQELYRLRKRMPVVASLGDYAASGGYYIASAAHELVAEPGTITGSIGVFGGKVVWGDLIKRVGVNPFVIQRGANAGLFSPLSRFSDGERAVLRAMMTKTYDTFIGRVATGRAMKVQAVKRVAQGRVWSGSKALKHGLVDRMGGMATAFERVAKRASISLSKSAVVTFPKSRSLMELLESDRTELSFRQWLGNALSRMLERSLGGLGGEFLSLLGTVRDLIVSERVVAMAPFALRIE